MKRITLIMLVLVAVTAGCKDQPSSGDRTHSGPTTSASSSVAQESHTLITRYNQLLSEGYKTTDMTKLQEVASKELAEKAFYHMAAIGEGKRRLVSELKKIDFIETDCSTPLKCRVVTRERWDFAYADIVTGARSNEVKDYIYDVQYLMENRQGKWLLTEISATGEERKELPSWGKMFKKPQ